MDIWIFLVIQENISSSEIWGNIKSFVSWKMTAVYLKHLPSTYSQTRWLDKVSSLLENKGRLVRLMEGSFVVLA